MFFCQDHEGSGSGDAAQEEAELLLLPKFLSHPQNVTVIEGSSFDLHCIVDNLGKHKREPIVFLYYFKNSNQNQKFYNGGYNELMFQSSTSAFLLQMIIFIS